MDTCNNCSTEIFNGILSKNLRLSDLQIKIISEYTNDSSTDYCQACGEDKFRLARMSLQEEYISLTDYIQRFIFVIPITAIDNPHGWIYNHVGVVSAHTILRSRELTNSIDQLSSMDLSAVHPTNITLCKKEETSYQQLRFNCLNAGGNAIIGLRKSFNTFTHATIKIHLNMYGSAVRLESFNQLGQNQELMEEVSSKNVKRRYLKELLAGI